MLKCKASIFAYEDVDLWRFPDDKLRTVKKEKIFKALYSFSPA